MAQSSMEFENLTGPALERAVMHDFIVDLKAKEQVVGHDWADYAGSFTDAENSEIHAFKQGYLCALKRLRGLD